MRLIDYMPLNTRLNPSLSHSHSRNPISKVEQIKRKKKATYLNAFLFEIDATGELLAQHHVRIVGLVERELQLFQLLLAEYGAVTPLALALLLLMLLMVLMMLMMDRRMRMRRRWRMVHTRRRIGRRMLMLLLLLVVRVVVWRSHRVHVHHVRHEVSMLMRRRVHELLLLLVMLAG